MCIYKISFYTDSPPTQKLSRRNWVTSAFLSATCPRPANSLSASWRLRISRKWTWEDCQVTYFLPPSSKRVSAGTSTIHLLHSYINVFLYYYYFFFSKKVAMYKCMSRVYFVKILPCSLNIPSVSCCVCPLLHCTRHCTPLVLPLPMQKWLHSRADSAVTLSHQSQQQQRSSHELGSCGRHQLAV